MTINISANALAYIKSKNETSVYITLTQYSTEGGIRFNPVIKWGKPEDPDRYSQVEVSGITVFTRKDIKALNDILDIGLTNLVVYKKLSVKGLDEENIYT